LTWLVALTTVQHYRADCDAFDSSQASASTSGEISEKCTSTQSGRMETGNKAATTTVKTCKKTAAATVDNMKLQGKSKKQKPSPAQELKTMRTEKSKRARNKGEYRVPLAENYMTL